MPTMLPGQRAGYPVGSGYHNRDLALHKYLLLQEQHESLREHLDQLRPAGSAVSPGTSNASADYGLDHSHSSSPAQGSAHNHHRTTSLRTLLRQPGSAGPRSSMAPKTITHGDTVLLALEEAKLCDVNERIKRALTELLNCDTVRADGAFRTWVQCRLMDTERELRYGRRRRS